MGVSRRRYVTTTRRARNRYAPPDLVSRNFEAAAPDRLWVADITYVPTHAGFLYLAVVIDAWSRRVVGWAMRNDLKTPLVLDALDMALRQRRPNGVIHHSDQGCQYTSIAFGLRCKAQGVRPSTGSVGDAYDNAMCESFFATLECELIDRSRFRNLFEARSAVFEFIEGWYNPRRRHSALGYRSPNEFEKAFATQARLEACLPPNPSTPDPMPNDAGSSVCYDASVSTEAGSSTPPWPPSETLAPSVSVTVAS